MLEPELVLGRPSDTHSCVKLAKMDAAIAKRWPRVSKCRSTPAADDRMPTSACQAPRQPSQGIHCDRSYPQAHPGSHAESTLVIVLRPNVPTQSANSSETDQQSRERGQAPSVSVVSLVFNRREELRETLSRMQAVDYESERLEYIVVDNASTDGSAAMVKEEFPDVRLIVREENCGVSGFNDGFDAAGSDYVLALDDDCYLPPDGLKRAVEAAQEQRADLVSFGVVSAFDPEVRFDKNYPTGLLSFWGCAVLIRREVLDELRGYDPNIFVWANELEFMLRFFDRGFRHLHMPEVLAVHIKGEGNFVAAYMLNARNFGYIAAKLLRPRDALGSLFARLATHVRDAIRKDRRLVRGIPHALAGFAKGLSARSPVKNREISRVYRRHFISFASPWWLSRSPIEFVRYPGGTLRRRTEFFDNRYHPKSEATLKF
jgi:GT2 family glycosyltransferase